MEEKGKKLTTINHVGLGLGGAIGTGIFVMLGYGIAQTGRSIMLACAIGCFFMLLAYWFNFAMSMVFVVKSGDYGMKQMMLGPVMTGISGYMLLVQAFSIASYAVAVVQFASVLWPGITNYAMLAEIVLMTLFYLATVKGSRVLTLVENAITALLVVALTLFVVFGVPQVDAGAFFSNTNSDSPFFYAGVGGFFGAISIMSYACMGTMGSISMAAVTENPKRTIPTAILIITVLLAAIYALMGYVAAGILPYAQIAAQNISVTAEVIMPRPLFLFFTVGGGICAIVSSALTTIGILRYPGVQMANDGWLPAVFKKSTKDGYPYVFYGLLYLIGVIPLVINMELDSIVSLVMMPAMFICAYMNFKMIGLNKNFPEQWEKRSIKIPVWFWNFCSALGVLCSIVVIYNLVKGLSGRDAVIAVICFFSMIGLAALRVKQGAVSKEKLEENKKAVIAEAVAES